MDTGHSLPPTCMWDTACPLSANIQKDTACLLPACETQPVLSCMTACHLSVYRTQPAYNLLGYSLPTTC